MNFGDSFATMLTVKRTVFCHPDDESDIKESLKAEDVRIVTSSIIVPGSFLHSKDVKIVDIGLKLKKPTNPNDWGVYKNYEIH